MDYYSIIKADASKVVASNTTRVRVELGFRPRYITIVGWNSSNNQGTNCIFDSDMNTTKQYRVIIGGASQTADVVSLGNDNYVGCIYSIDNTGFYITNNSSSTSFTSTYWYYTAVS